MNIAQETMTRQAPHKPLAVNKRKYAEHCQYGDVVEWDRPPRIRIGPDELDAPSSEGVVSMRIGPEPCTAFVRFLVDGRESEPFQVVWGQALVVRSGR